MRLGGLSFDLQYLLGLAPWDTQVTPPEVVELVEGAGVPPGRALDLGCGSGTNCIYLACHGWEAVGVDFSAVAIRRARRKARRDRVDCKFYRADVTVDQPGVRPYMGHWELEGDRRYSMCFYIVRGFGSERSLAFSGNEGGRQ